MSARPAPPTGWIPAEIGQIASLRNGAAFKPTDWTPSGLPIVRIQNLNRPDAAFNFFSGNLDAKFRIKSGDLLFAWSGTPGTSFGAHIWRGGDAWLNQHIFRVDFDEAAIDKRFLMYAINENLQDYVRQAHGGAGLAHITKGKFERSTIALPPFTEQRRIVEAIEAHFTQLDAAVAALERVRANLKRYRASVLKAGCLNPNLPDWKALDELVDEERSIAYGVLKPGEQSPGGIPLIKTLHVQNGRLLETQDYISPQLSQEFKRTVVKGGEVLLTVVGSIGRTAIVPPWASGYNLSRSVAVIPLQRTDDNEWVRMCLEAFFGTREAKEIATGTAQAVLNLGDVRQIKIPMPPVAVRKQIVAEIERRLSVADALAAEVGAGLKRCERMRQAILKKAFEGRLVPQDPNGELGKLPASVARNAGGR